jgi:hypothetical protein
MIMFFQATCLVGPAQKTFHFTSDLCFLDTVSKNVNYHITNKSTCQAYFLKKINFFWKNL